MKGNTDKCHLIASTENATELQIGDSLIKTSSCEKLLGVKLIINWLLMNILKKQTINWEL